MIETETGFHWKRSQQKKVTDLGNTFCENSEIRNVKPDKHKQLVPRHSL